MSSPATVFENPAPLTSPENPHSMTRKLAVFCLWLLGTSIALFFAMIQADSAIVGDLYIPRTNDSFYHAWRILDAAFGDGLAQYDARLNPPDGTLIPWPWAYDFFMAKLTQLALWVQPELDAMAFLSYVPVAWLGINSALFLGAAGAAGLSLPLRALAMLGFALSPLTQQLHSVAILDHHYVEFTFVLASIWLGMAWLARPDRRARAIALGALLGAAPAFHVGLFLLQLIPLVTIVILWLRQNAPPRGALVGFAVSLVVMTQLVVLPSMAYREGSFDYSFLSWFHFYVSCSTAVMVALMGFWAFTLRRLAVLGAVAAALAIPMLTNLIQGTAFVTGQVSILPDIAEAHSPFRFDGGAIGDSDSIRYFSWLLLAVPLIGLYFAHRALCESKPVLFRGGGSTRPRAALAAVPLPSLRPVRNAHGGAAHRRRPAATTGLACRRRVRRCASRHHACVSAAASRAAIHDLRCRGGRGLRVRHGDSSRAGGSLCRGPGARARRQ